MGGTSMDNVRQCPGGVAWTRGFASDTSPTWGGGRPAGNHRHNRVALGLGASSSHRAQHRWAKRKCQPSDPPQHSQGRGTHRNRPHQSRTLARCRRGRTASCRSTRTGSPPRTAAALGGDAIGPWRSFNNSRQLRRKPFVVGGCHTAAANNKWPNAGGGGKTVWEKIVSIQMQAGRGRHTGRSLSKKNTDAISAHSMKNLQKEAEKMATFWQKWVEFGGNFLGKICVSTFQFSTPFEPQSGPCSPQAYRWSLRGGPWREGGKINNPVLMDRLVDGMALRKDKTKAKGGKSGETPPPSQPPPKNVPVGLILGGPLARHQGKLGLHPRFKVKKSTCAGEKSAVSHGHASHWPRVALATPGIQPCKTRAPIPRRQRLTRHTVRRGRQGGGCGPRLGGGDMLAAHC